MSLMAAKTKPPARESSDPKEDAKHLAALLKKAMEQPGVREVMQVYGESTKVNEVLSVYQAYQNPYPANTVSSSSEPTLF